MKSAYKIIILLSLVMGIDGGCSKKLVEHPYTVFTTAYYQTEDGLASAVTALYAGMRWNFGPEGALDIQAEGTDEFTYADQVRGGAVQNALPLGNYTLDPTNGAILTPWNYNFTNINLANNVISLAPGVCGPDTVTRNSLVSQARFLRALNYLLLVQQFGAVPVDLGSGPLQPNTKPFEGFNRLPTDSVLAEDYQDMIDDFTYASQYLPAQRPAGAFYLSQAAAITLLAKTYIYRGFSAAKQPGDFQNAYNVAMSVINDTAQYGCGLVQNFADISAPGNDYNGEILYSVERIPGNYNADEIYSPSTTIGGGKGVDAANDFTPNYNGVHNKGIANGSTLAGTRGLLYGRPIRRFCPTPWLFNTLFADKYNDSRFDGSFRMMWLAVNSTTLATTPADTAFMLAESTDAFSDSIATGRFIDNGDGSAYTAYNNAVSGTTWTLVSPVDFYIIGSSQGGLNSADIYPQLDKYDDPARAAANDEGSRPFPVVKLSETYLLAAEAAYQMKNSTQAAALINVLRERAAYRPGLSPSDLQARQSAMDVNAGQITEDFILDERARELCGESIRWSDLAMRFDEGGTNELLKRVKAYNADAAPNIQPFHVLRPIPISQLQACSAIPVGNYPQYQNPGY